MSPVKISKAIQMIHRLIRIDYINFILHWRGKWNSIIFWGYSFIVFLLQNFTRLFPIIFTLCVQWITLVFLWFLWLAILSLLFSHSCGWLPATPWTAASHGFPVLDLLPLSAGVLPQLIQGIRSGDGVGDLFI